MKFGLIEADMMIMKVGTNFLDIAHLNYDYSFFNSSPYSNAGSPFFHIYSERKNKSQSLPLSYFLHHSSGVGQARVDFTDGIVFTGNEIISKKKVWLK